MNRSTLRRSAASAAAMTGLLAAGCAPTTEQPSTNPVDVAPTVKAVIGAQTPAPKPPASAGPSATATVLPDGTLNRNGGRPDANDNGSWQMSVAPPKPPPTTIDCSSLQYPCW